MIAGRSTGGGDGGFWKRRHGRKAADHGLVSRIHAALHHYFPVLRLLRLCSYSFLIEETGKLIVEKAHGLFWYKAYRTAKIPGWSRGSDDVLAPAPRHAAEVPLSCTLPQRPYRPLQDLDFKAVCLFLLCYRQKTPQ